MQKNWLCAMAGLLLASGLSATAFAEQLGADEMQSIRQYCDEMYGFGSFASEEERLQAVDNCINEEVSRAREYGNPDGEAAPEMEKPE